MPDDFAVPVKGIVKALEVGIKLTKRIATSASQGPENFIYISELAQTLQRNLEKSSQAIADAYRDAVRSCGEDFAKALMEDEAIQNRLKEVKIDLRDQIDECQDFDENLESFQQSAFTSVKQQSKRCRTECTFIFNNVRDRIDQTDLNHFRMEDKSPPLSPIYIPIREQTPRRIPVQVPINLTTLPSAASPLRVNRENVGNNENKVSVPEPSKTSPTKENPWSLSGPYFDVGPRTPPRCQSPEPRRKRSQGQTSQGGSSRHDSLRDRDATPAPSNTTKPDSEHFSPASLKPPTPLSATPMSPGISEYQPSESGISLWMKSPVSPPMSEAHDPASWGRLAPTTTTPSSTTSIATTLQLPGYGAGVEDGLEVVPVFESGLEVVPTQDPEPVPIQPPNPIVENRSQSQLAMHRATPSLRSIDCPMRHDSSGETGFKVVKRPSGHYSATLSARCIKCAYEVSGIYSNTGIRWRQRFISKCHLKTTSVDDPIYGCIFCIEDHRTVEDHDATVFFSVTSLFRHLARHPRPSLR
ncbi:hypothetical protein DID88_000065 [Monilinia fructigena]|uniref:Uncharacterized protein n=1 Tax=Monilinia fructigena TaxID=38457 RepID=A0A395IJA0_9HELO|nr:hypothetical protein DID88_000065 [Monilinia fructigena]